MTASKALATTHKHAIASAGADISELFEANIGTGGMSAYELDRVKIPSGGGLAWAVPTLDGEEPAKEITGVIIAWQDKRAYWSTSIEDSGGGSPPDCSSEDAITGRGDPGGDCLACPLSQFGSAVKGTGQACKALRFLLVARPDDLIPVLVPLPPTSIAPLKKYFLRLLSAKKRYNHVVTRLTLERKTNAANTAYSAAVPAFVEDLSAEEALAIDQVTDTMKSILRGTQVQGGDYNVAPAPWDEA